MIPRNLALLRVRGFHPTQSYSHQRQETHLESKKMVSDMGWVYHTSQVRSPRHIIEMIFATSRASMLAADEDVNTQGFLYLFTAAVTR